jgi:hypothetical protein
VNLRMPFTGRRRPSLAPDVAAAIGGERSDRPLAWAEDGQGATMVAGRHRLHVVRRTPGGGAEHVLDRPWHLVDSGTWTGADISLTVTWVDRHQPTRLVLPDPGLLPETLRERVQASVVLAETLDLGGRRSARVVVRRVLATDELVSQAVLGPGVRIDDPGVREEVLAGLARVREQVGLT